MNILTQRNDEDRAGVNKSEKNLTPKNVNVNTFGKLHATPLNAGGADRGAIYAQPLYVSGLDFGPPHGKRDAVFVATMGNWVFAIDANTGEILVQSWIENKTPVRSQSYFGTNYNDVVKPSGKDPTIGILSTPVINMETKELFLALYTIDEMKANAPGATEADKVGAFQYILYALDLTTLQKKRSAVITGSVSGAGYHNSARAAQNIEKLGNLVKFDPEKGELAVRSRFKSNAPNIDVIDATGIGTHDPRVHFHAMMQLQRPGLLLRKGVIYIAFGARGDIDPYHGWIFAYRADDLAQLDVFCTTPNGAQGGIWQAGQGLVANDQGIYAGVGNGDSRRLISAQPGTPDVGESFLKLRLENDRLNLIGWYNAFDDLVYSPVTGRHGEVNEEVKARDDDLGAASPVMLPDGRIAGGGKDGYFYLIDVDQLIGNAAERQFSPAADNVVLQYLLASYNFERGTRRVPTQLPALNNQAALNQQDATHHIHGAPVVWDPVVQQGDTEHTYVYVWGENDVARVYRYAKRQSGQPLSGGFPDQGAIAVAPLITADWQRVIPRHGVEIARGTLVASNEDTRRQAMPGGALSLSWDGQNKNSAVLWACFPSFDNGNLWSVGGELVAYDAVQFDDQLNFSRLEAVWRSRQNPEDDFGTFPKFCCPSVADGKVFVPAGDGSALFIYGLKPGGARGGYDLGRDTQTPAFGGPSGLTLNGSVNIGHAMPNAEGRQVRPLVLTSNPIDRGDRNVVDRKLVPTFLAGSVFCTDPIDVTNLKTTFTAQLIGLDPNNMADGFTFTVQATGSQALGSSGSGLGYALDPFDATGTGACVPRSLALAFNVVNNTISLWRDGAGGTPPFHDLGQNGIALNTGHPLRVVVNYSHGDRRLLLTVTDLNAPQNTTGPLALNDVDIPSFLKLRESCNGSYWLYSGNGSQERRAANPGLERSVAARPVPQQFPESIHWPGPPSGPSVALDAGPLQARVYTQTGHIELAGPTLGDAAHGNAVQLTPLAVQRPTGTALAGKVVSTQADPNRIAVRQELGTTVMSALLSFPHEGVLKYEVTDWGGQAPSQTAIAVLAAPHEHAYGFGERFITLDQTGRVLQTLTFDEPGVKKDHAYKVAGWFVSTRGYGVHLLSAFESTFDMRGAATGRFVMTNPTSHLAFQIVYGPRLTDVLTRFTGYAGRPPLSPAFAFGPWISSDIWHSGGEVRYAVTQFRRHAIPASAFVFDSPWEVAYNDFQFNMAQFGRDATIDGEHYPGFVSLEEMMQFLQSNGLKVICWMTPFVNTSSTSDGVPGQNLGKAANYDEAAQRGFFVQQDGHTLVVPWWKGRGSPIDFTNQGAREWLANQLRSLLKQTEVTTRSGTKQTAIGGWKTDDGESGNGPNTYIPVRAHYADGRTGAEMRNGYCLEYQKAVWSVLGDSGVLFARSGFVGSQAFPGSWAGDNEPNFGDNGLPGVIVAGQSAAVSGYAIWGHDIGGYQDRNFSVSPPNLFIRWTQFGCFSPIMQMHRQVEKEMQYPWRYGQQAVDNYRFYARLHTKLFPYIYSYAKQAAETGLPIIRPLVLLAQDDPNTFGVGHTYNFGNEFLVAPVVQPNATVRDVYLPAGAWYDFWTRQRHAGGQAVTWSDPDPTHLPLFVREGGIVPLLLNETDTLCDADYVNNPNLQTVTPGLHVLFFPGPAGSWFKLFDGSSFDCARAGGASLIVTVSAQARPLLLEVHTGASPASVQHDGTPLFNAPTTADFDAAANAWRFDPQSQAVFVKLNHMGGTTLVRL